VCQGPEGFRKLAFSGVSGAGGRGKGGPGFRCGPGCARERSGVARDSAAVPIENVKITPFLLALTCLTAAGAPRAKSTVRPASGKSKTAEKGKPVEKEKEKQKEPEKAGEKDKGEEKEGDEKKKEPADASKDPSSPEAKTASLKPDELENFGKLPKPTQEVLRYALSLTERGLSYKTGSADPDTGGTDCSGYVYHVLQSRGHAAVPRQSDEMYAWTWKAGTFRACNGVSTETFEFSELRPGDLLFWVNSTKDGKTARNPPVTHVMFYLGKRASDGHPLAAGASDGRTYDGQRMSGVSVFDFRLPSVESRARFIGYAHLPGESAAAAPQPPSPAPAKSPPSAPAKAKPKKPSGNGKQARAFCRGLFRC
jgi:cell wall-associated NlpC family hydrolase